MSRQGKLDGFGTRAGNQRSAVRTPGRRDAGAGLFAEHAAAGGDVEIRHAGLRGLP